MPLPANALAASLLV